jgi:hypothetical protein
MIQFKEKNREDSFLTKETIFHFKRDKYISSDIIYYLGYVTKQTNQFISKLQKTDFI